MTAQLYRRRAGTPVTLAECPVGLFECGGELCLKTEYGNNEGRIDAYIVSSGEFFWGAAPQTIASQRATVVTPIDYEPLPAPAPYHTDLMVSPESLDAWLEENPLPEEPAPAPDAREALDQATLNLIREAIRFSYWAAGQGICPMDGEPARDPETFLSEYWNVHEADADREDIENCVLARIGGGA